MTTNENSNRLSAKEAALLRRVVLEKYSKRAVLLRALHQYNKIQEQGFPTQAPSNPFGSDDDDDDWSITSREDDDDGDDGNDEHWYVRTENRVIYIYCERIGQGSAKQNDVDTSITAPSVASSTPSIDSKVRDDKPAEEAPTCSSDTGKVSVTKSDSKSASLDEPKKKVIISTTALIDKVLKEQKNEQKEMVAKPDLPVNSSDSRQQPTNNSLVRGAETTRNKSIASPNTELSAAPKVKSAKDKIAFWNKLAQKETADDTNKVQQLSKSIPKSIGQKKYVSNPREQWALKKKLEKGATLEQSTAIGKEVEKQ